LRSVDDASGEDNLALDVERALRPVLFVDDARGPGAVEPDPGGQGLGDDAQVGARAHVLGEVGVGRGAVSARLEDGLVPVGDVGRGAVDVSARPVADLGEGEYPADPSRVTTPSSTRK
jgi:hypothetical protein